MLLDADPSQALSRWARSAYEGVPFETLAEPDETRLAHLIAEKAEAADLVIVDTAGFGNRAASVAMTSADAVIVPTLSGEADVTEAEKTMRLIEGLARAARREIPARVLLNRVRKHPRPPCRGRGDSCGTRPIQCHSQRSRCLWRNDLQRPCADDGDCWRRGCRPNRRNARTRLGACNCHVT